MSKKIYHPNAYLLDYRNIKPGLKSRTVILNLIEEVADEAKKISERSRLNYRVVLHHLKLLESRGVVERRGNRPYIWKLTGLGQKRLER